MKRKDIIKTIRVASRVLDCMEGGYEPRSPLSLVNDMTDLHGAVKFGISGDADD